MGKRGIVPLTILQNMQAAAEDIVVFVCGFGRESLVV